MEQAHEQVDGVLTAGQHAPEGRARVARALRYLAEEVEAGRAAADVDFNIDTVMRAKPRGWQDAGKPPEYEQQTYGARWRVAVATLGEPPAELTGGAVPRAAGLPGEHAPSCKGAREPERPESSAPPRPATVSP